MSDRIFYGIDIGGTNIRLGVLVNGILQKEIRSLKVPQNRSHNDILQLLYKIIIDEQNHSKSPLGIGIGIGIGAPGIVDYKNGIILSSPHYPDWNNFRLRDNLSDLLKLPIALDNDANVIAIGEAKHGVGKNLENFLMVTLGTGIGGGIIINRNIFRGTSGFAGEIGHIVINFQSKEMGVSSRSTWEAFASASGFSNIVEQVSLKNTTAAYSEMTPKKFAEAASTRDQFALSVWKQFGCNLGAGLASIVNVLGIEDIVIGGGLSQSWDLFIDEAKSSIAANTYSSVAKRIHLHKAELGDAAGIIGAAEQASTLIL